MISVLVGSFPNTSLITNGGNRWQSQNYTKNYYASSYASKASREYKKKIKKEYNFLRFEQPSLKYPYGGIDGGSTFQECNRKYVAKTTPGPSFESEPHSLDSKNILDSVKDFMDAFWKFASPYGVSNVLLSIILASFLAVEKLSDISPLFFTGLLQALVPNVFIAIYASGINQLCDIEIDKINKPYLPLASGKISYTVGVIIVVSSLFLSLWLGWIVGSWPLIWALISIFAIWTTYSVDLPLLRWKRNSVLTAIASVATFGVSYPIGYFLHMQTFVFKRPAVFSRPLIFATILASLFSVVIAFFKDIPDIEGDQAHGIQTFAGRLGQKRVYWICIFLLEMTYGIALLMGATSSCLWRKIVTGLAHVILASVVWYRANKSIDLRSKASILSFYWSIWKLMYVEYLLIPLLR